LSFDLLTYADDTLNDLFRAGGFNWRLYHEKKIQNHIYDGLGFVFIEFVTGFGLHAAF
jgi:hypothetical protein